MMLSIDCSCLYLLVVKDCDPYAFCAEVVRGAARKIERAAEVRSRPEVANGKIQSSSIRRIDDPKEGVAGKLLARDEAVGGVVGRSIGTWLPKEPIGSSIIRCAAPIPFSDEIPHAMWSENIRTASIVGGV
jgi:hypothetical protein